VTFVISLGGSIVAPPEGPDAAFLTEFKALAESWLAGSQDGRLILVVGGGGPARLWQKACRDVYAAATPPDRELDWIGIAATRLNAQLVKAVFGPLCPDEVVTDPSASVAFSGRILVAAGWKPGFSTDFDAVWLAERFGAPLVLNLSNIAKVYTADPRLDPGATPIDRITWPEFRKMVGNEWSPGANLPFDPIASAKAEKAGISVICAAGRDLANLKRILDGEAYVGTFIGDGPGDDRAVRQLPRRTGASA